MPSIVYIDGFNLYYGSLRKSPYKWLNLAKLCSTLYPAAEISRIRYFTARVPGKLDPNAPRRQKLYLRALRTIPNLSIHYGHFTAWPVYLPCYPLQFCKNIGSVRYLSHQVYRPSEKGSDVNLATYLLDDCFNNECDEAIVISNDSDLKLPIQFVTSKYGKKVHVVNPHLRTKLSADLAEVASSNMPEINRSVLRAAQFALSLADARGTFSKPPLWA